MSATHTHARRSVANRKQAPRSGLIAAAPELLQALKALRDECSGSPRPWVLVDLLTTATEAIAKAEGRA